MISEVKLAVKFNSLQTSFRVVSRVDPRVDATVDACTPQPLYNTIVGVHSIIRVS